MAAWLGCLDGCLDGCLVGCLFCSLPGCLAGYLVGCWVGWLALLGSCLVEFINQPVNHVSSHICLIDSGKTCPLHGMCAQVSASSTSVATSVKTAIRFKCLRLSLNNMSVAEDPWQLMWSSTLGGEVWFHHGTGERRWPDAAWSRLFSNTMG